MVLPHHRLTPTTLLAALDDLEWPERVKTMQRNWIGRSEGAQFEMEVVGSHRADRGVHHQARHRLRHDFCRAGPRAPPGTGRSDARSAGKRSTAFIERVRQEPEFERQSTEISLEKRGIFTGAYAINPFNGKEVPIYLADYVLMGYGTGAIMAVPAEDQRDWEFATAYGLPIIRTVQPPKGWEGEAYTGDGPRINSEWLDGIVDTAEAKDKAIDWLEEHGIGKRTVQYRLRDWLVSRQRYWGCPIPVVYCPDDGIVPVPETELPVLLPDDVEFLPDGRVPAAQRRGFLWTTCPICGQPGRT